MDIEQAVSDEADKAVAELAHSLVAQGIPAALVIDRLLTYAVAHIVAYETKAAAVSFFRQAARKIDSGHFDDAVKRARQRFTQ